MVVNDFNIIAPFYDALVRVVFGKSILDAQIANMSEIKSTDSVLIIGGGTGKILEYLPNCVRIDYIEKSAQMIRLARKRLVNRSIDFLNHDFLEWKSDKTYDVIICPFFLDCFSEANLKRAIAQFEILIKNDGIVLVIDFDKTKINPVLLKIMLIFFKICARLEAGVLLNIRNVFHGHGFVENEIKFFKKGIFSARYTRAKKK